MTVPGSVVAQLFRIGREAEVYERTETGTNEFGNTTTDYGSSPDRTIIAYRTYPNRNTEVEASSGDRERDHPVFIVPVGPNQPALPGKNDHIVYDGTTYEVQAYTEYDTHVEFFGEPVLH